MKNVLHLCESSSTGGAESVLISIVEGLDKKRYRSQVCLLSDGWLKRELDRRGIDNAIVSQPHSVDPAWLYRIYRLLKDRKIHVMHSHEFATNVYASFLSRLTGIPLVATIHGKNYYGDRWRRRAAYRFVARHSSMTVVSADLKRFVAETIGITPARLHVVHNGIDISRYDLGDQHRAVRAELGVSDRQRVIGTVGNLFAVKGQTYLLKACREVQRVFHDFVLLIAGEGDQLEPLRREASELGLAHNVRFLGFRNDVPLLLQAIDVFALPSLSEGLPLCILEAMAVRKPVVATNVGGVAEVVDEGLTGYLVPPRNPQAMAEKLISLLSNPRAAANMGEIGRRKVEEGFRLEKMVRQYESMYDGLLARLNSEDTAASAMCS